MADISSFENDNFRIIIFVGANQTKIPLKLASSLQRMGKKAEYVEIAGNGPNALDFHIAFYLGKLTASEPEAYFHIISKDKGFDPLIQHLKAKKILIGRSSDVNEIPMVRIVNIKSNEERIQMVIDKIKQPQVSKPRTVKTLSSTIAALFHKEISDDEIAAVISGMVTIKFITVTENKVTYALTTG
jgi:hypothetical protein